MITSIRTFHAYNFTVREHSWLLQALLNCPSVVFFSFTVTTNFYRTLPKTTSVLEMQIKKVYSDFTLFSLVLVVTKSLIISFPSIIKHTILTKSTWTFFFFLVFCFMRFDILWLNCDKQIFTARPYLSSFCSQVYE